MKDEDAAIDELVEEAETLEGKGARLEAIAVLRQALRLREDPVVLTRIGSIALDLQLWTDAEIALRQATKLEPHVTEPYFYLGLLYRAQDRLEEALDCLENVTGNAPSAENLTVLGVIQGDLDLLNESRASFRKAITFDPKFEEAYYNLATSLRHDNEDESRALLEKAIEIDPGYAMAHRELGLLLRMADQIVEAEYHLRRAIELDPLDGWSYIYLGNLLWGSEDFVSAENAFRKAIEVWPDQSVPYWSLAHYLECRGQYQQAKELYREALKIDPADAQANWRFGSYLKDRGEQEEAKTYLSRALELNPSERRAAAALADLE
jgi:protein O-GlcNAc transferase